VQEGIEKKMRKTGQSQIVGLLGVGFDHQDEEIRITQAEDYKVIMGSRESHQALQNVCGKINQVIKESGRVLSDYTPKEFMELMQEIT